MFKFHKFDDSLKEVEISEITPQINEIVAIDEETNLQEEEKNVAHPYSIKRKAGMCALFLFCGYLGFMTYLFIQG